MDLTNRNLEPSATLFGQRIQDLLDERGWKPVQLADAVGVSYEHIRKLLRGLNTPSVPMVKLIASTLKVPEGELLRKASSDKIQKEHGGIALELAGKDPEVEPFERGFSKLTKQQKDILTSQLKAFLSQNRKHRLEKLK